MDIALALATAEMLEEQPGAIVEWMLLWSFGCDV